jgi:hypothetical protein
MSQEQDSVSRARAAKRTEDKPKLHRIGSSDADARRVLEFARGTYSQRRQAAGSCEAPL